MSTLAELGVIIAVYVVSVVVAIIAGIIAVWIVAMMYIFLR